MALVAGVRWASRCKDAGSPGSGTTGATEDTAARRPARRRGTVSISPNPPSRTLLLTLVEEQELVEVDGLSAGAAAAGPAAQDGLQQQHGLRER